jgi:4'-phosphopantetheinyl transferase
MSNRVVMNAKRPPAPPAPPLRPELRRDEIQLWRIPLDLPADEVSRLRSVLAPAEQMQAARFRFARDERRFIVRRAVRRQLLASVLEVPPQRLELGTGDNGKPLINTANTVAPLKFNCSHSGDWALIAMTRASELGVDLEQQHDLPDAEELAKNYFSPREIQAWTALPATRKRQAFFDGWSRKEAFLKAIGLGLAFPLNRFSVSLAPDQPPALLEVDGDAAAAKKWFLIALEVVPGFSAALVHAAGDFKIVPCDWRFDQGT